MSQPLIVEFAKKNRSFAGIFFRWGDYTMSALSDIKSLLTHVCNTEDENEVRKNLIFWASNNTSFGNILDNPHLQEPHDSAICEVIGAEITGQNPTIQDSLLASEGIVSKEDRAFAKALMPGLNTQPTSDINSGIVFLTHGSTKDAEQYACSIAVINIDTGIVDFNTWYYFGDQTEYESEWKEDIENGDYPAFDEIPIINQNIEQFEFDKIDDIIEFAKNVQGPWRMNDTIMNITE